MSLRAGGEQAQRLEVFTCGGCRHSFPSFGTPTRADCVRCGRQTRVYGRPTPEVGWGADRRRDRQPEGFRGRFGGGR